MQKINERTIVADILKYLIYAVLFAGTMWLIEYLLHRRLRYTPGVATTVTIILAGLLGLIVANFDRINAKQDRRMARLEKRIRELESKNQA